MYGKDSGKLGEDRRVRERKIRKKRGQMKERNREIVKEEGINQKKKKGRRKREVGRNKKGEKTTTTKNEIE